MNLWLVEPCQIQYFKTLFSAELLTCISGLIFLGKTVAYLFQAPLFNMNTLHGGKFSNLEHSEEDLEVSRLERFKTNSDL